MKKFVSLLTHYIASILLGVTFCTTTSATTIAVTNGALVLNLDSNAWATGVAPGTYESYGTNMTPGQPHMTLARYYSAADMNYRKLIGSGTRPDTNGIRPVVNISTNATPVWSVDIRQFRAAYNSNPPATTGLVFPVFKTAPVAPFNPVGSNRFPHGSNFTIDSSGAWNTVSGEIGTGGALAFYYANDALLGYPNSGRWLSIGEFAISYDPNRATDWGLPNISGWILTSSVMGDAVAFDTTNVVVNVFSNGITMSGTLVQAPDLQAYTAFSDNIYLGTFSFSSLPPQSFSITTASIGTNGTAALRFPAELGKTYKVQYKTNLTDASWTEIAAPVFTVPAAGTNQWVDDGSLTGGPGSQRFYRISAQ